jgi:hypothetical protein
MANTTSSAVIPSAIVAPTNSDIACAVSAAAARYIYRDGESAAVATWYNNVWKR